MKTLIKNKLLIAFPVIVLFSFIQSNINAQVAISASGGNASGSDGTVSYTIGQTVCTTNTGTAGSIAQGVQQPFEISVVTGIEQAKNITLDLSVYPNPSTDKMILKIENYDSQNLSYQLFDANGKLMERKKVMGNETTVSLTNLLPSLYFLKVIDGRKEIKTFKIIKK